MRRPSEFLRPFSPAVRLGFAGLAVAAIGGLAAACGGGGDVDDAALLARNQTSGSCDAPPLAPATLTPFGENPLGGIATLTAQPEPAKVSGNPSEQVVREVTAAAKNFLNCWNQRRFEGAVALASTNYLKMHFVLQNTADIMVTLRGTPELTWTVRSLGDAKGHEDGRVSLAIEYTWIHQQIAARWYFIKKNGRWFLDQEERQHVDLGVANTDVDVDMMEFAYKLSTSTIKESPSVTFRARNVGGLPHETFVLKLTSNFDPTKLFQPNTRPEGVEFFGHTVEMAGNTGEITITDMKPGQYVIVCQFRFPGGPIATHGQRGMITTFTVEPK
jgi:uncharacterized cupredoxin-like copper-binding protein